MLCCCLSTEPCSALPSTLFLLPDLAACAVSQEKGHGGKHCQHLLSALCLQGLYHRQQRQRGSESTWAQNATPWFLGRRAAALTCSYCLVGLLYCGCWTGTGRGAQYPEELPLSFAWRSDTLDPRSLSSSRQTLLVFLSLLTKWFLWGSWTGWCLWWQTSFVTC